MPLGNLISVLEYLQSEMLFCSICIEGSTVLGTRRSLNTLT